MDRNVRRKRRWWLLALVALALAMAAFAFNTPQDSLEFITKHRGARLPAYDKSQNPNVVYAFYDDPSDVEHSVLGETRRRGWTKANHPIPMYADWNSPLPQQDMAHIIFFRSKGLEQMWKDLFRVPQSATCFVIVRSERPWLARQWKAVRGWLKG